VAASSGERGIKIWEDFDNGEEGTSDLEVLKAQKTRNKGAIKKIKYLCIGIVQSFNYEQTRFISKTLSRSYRIFFK
jgi:hypothetical protein